MRAVLAGAAALWLCAAGARADDGYVQVNGGAASLRAGEHPEISMDSETVILALREDGYSVDASFDFFNRGPAVDVSVGFPELGKVSGISDGLGYLPGQRLQDFRSWVDGVPVRVVDMPGEIKEDGAVSRFKDFDAWYADWRKRNPDDPDGDPPVVELEELRWLVKTVHFGARRRTLVRVRYRALYDAGNNGRHACYVYGTGGSWSGPIKTMTYLVETSSDVWAGDIDFGMKAAPSVARLGEHRSAYTFRDVKPDPEAQVDISVSSTRREDSVGGDSQPWEAADVWPMTRSPSYWDWKYANAPVPRELLETLSRRQLRLLRNTFFAGHGRRFKDPELRAYFESRGVDRYGWYKPQDGYDPSQLSFVERENVRLIADYERALRR